MKLTVGQLLTDCIGKDLLAEDGHTDLTITFVDPNAPVTQTEGSDDGPSEKILENVPTVRIILKKSKE